MIYVVSNYHTNLFYLSPVQHTFCVTAASGSCSEGLGGRTHVKHSGLGGGAGFLLQRNKIDLYESLNIKTFYGKSVYFVVEKKQRNEPGNIILHPLIERQECCSVYYVNLNLNTGQSILYLRRKTKSTLCNSQQGPLSYIFEYSDIRQIIKIRI